MTMVDLAVKRGTKLEEVWKWWEQLEVAGQNLNLFCRGP